MRTLNLLLLALLCAVLGGSERALAVTSDNPYVHPITNRNLFSLKAPTRPEDNLPPAPPPNIPKIQFVGITTIMGGKRAILRVPQPARPPEPAGERSLMLTENGPSEEGVKVLEINIAAGSVKINNHGLIQTLDLENDAPKSAPARAPGAGIPVPGQNPAGAIPVPRVSSSGSPAGGFASFARPVRGASAAASGGVVGAGPSGIANVSAAAAVPASGGGWSGPGLSGGGQANPGMSPEEQQVIIEANRVTDPDQAPILPPTPLGDILQEEADSGAAF